jgi:exosortase
VWYLAGWRAARATFLPVFFLWLAIPVPGLVQATNGLQVIATKLGFLGSQAFGIDAIYSGTNIQSGVAGKWGFDIAEGCSGIRSLMAMLLIAAVYVYLIDLPVWRKALVFVAALPLAIAVNAIRITSIILLAEFVDKDFAAGIYHDWASFFIFPLGIIGMLGVHQLLTLDRRVRRRVVRRMRNAAT